MKYTRIGRYEYPLRAIATAISVGALSAVVFVGWLVGG